MPNPFCRHTGEIGASTMICFLELVLIYTKHFNLIATYQCLYYNKHKYIPHDDAAHTEISFRLQFHILSSFKHLHPSKQYLYIQTFSLESFLENG
jgi:hypothetical protein